MKKILFYPDKCTTCELCELVCSALHETIFNPDLSRVKITGHYEGDELVVKGSVCNSCLACVQVCPCGAITADENGLKYYPEACSKYGVCVEECPRGIISKRPDGLIRICDLCGGDPQCVAWCPKGALALGCEP